MEVLLEIISAIMSDSIGNNNVPKWARYMITAVIIGFIVFLGIWVGTVSRYIIGRIAGFLIAALMLAAGVFLAIKIHKN